MHIIEILRIKKIGTTHGLGQRIFLSRRCYYVNMIRHQAISIYSRSELIGLLSQQLQKFYSIIIDEKHILPVITTLGNMMSTTFDYDLVIPSNSICQ